VLAAGSKNARFAIFVPPNVTAGNAVNPYVENAVRVIEDNHNTGEVLFPVDGNSCARSHRPTVR